MHPEHLNNPLVERSKREALLHAAPMLDRAIQAACGAIEEDQRNARSVSRRLQLGDAHAALLRYAPRLRAEFPQVLMQRIESALRAGRHPYLIPSCLIAETGGASPSVLAASPPTR